VRVGPEALTSVVAETGLSMITEARPEASSPRPPKRRGCLRGRPPGRLIANRERPVDALTLGYTDDRCVREVHGKVAVLRHQLSHAGHVSTVRGQEGDRLGFRLGVLPIRQEEHRLRDRRPDRAQRVTDAAQRGHAPGVMLVGAAEKRHHGSGVGEDHRRAARRA
jgi:hypothetical protein